MDLSVGWCRTVTLSQKDSNKNIDIVECVEYVREDAHKGDVWDLWEDCVPMSKYLVALSLDIMKTISKYLVKKWKYCVPVSCQVLPKKKNWTKKASQILRLCPDVKISCPEVLLFKVNRVTRIIWAGTTFSDSLINNQARACTAHKWKTQNHKY